MDLSIYFSIFDAFIEFIKYLLSPQTGFSLYFIIFSFVVYKCVVVPFWAFLGIKN